MTSAALVRLAFTVFLGAGGALLAAWGVRLVVNNKKIAEKKAVKRGSTAPPYYSAARAFGQTEEDIERIQGVTVMQGLSSLLLAAFLLYISFQALVHSAWR
jgi:steroid 5-alpha reductase family enzyme